MIPMYSKPVFLLIGLVVRQFRLPCRHTEFSGFYVLAAVELTQLFSFPCCAAAQPPALAQSQCIQYNIHYRMWMFHTYPLTCFRGLVVWVLPAPVWASLLKHEIRRAIGAVVLISIY